MLVLTRKSQQQIRIGNEITISILKVKGNAVSVGIEAPRDVRVVRGELAPLEESELKATAGDDGDARPRAHVRSAGQRTAAGRRSGMPASPPRGETPTPEGSADSGELPRKATSSLKEIVARRRPKLAIATVQAG